jgi:hypothetical protein
MHESAKQFKRGRNFMICYIRPSPVVKHFLGWSKVTGTPNFEVKARQKGGTAPLIYMENRASREAMTQQVANG